MTDAVLATPWTTFLRHANLHEQHKRRRSLIAVTAALGEAQHAHLFVCGRECGRKLRGTTRTNRHREHLSRICPDSAFAQVKGQIPRQGREPARGLEPLTPCLQAKPTFIRVVPRCARWAVTCGNVRADRVGSSVGDRPGRAVPPRFLPLPCRRPGSEYPLLARGTLLHTGARSTHRSAFIR